MNIHPNGFWENTTSEGHVHCPYLAGAISKLMTLEDIHSVADFGCGMGDYAKRWCRDGFQVDAFDGNPHTEELTDGVGIVADLSAPLITGGSYDCVVSLEVGEHIPRENERAFLDNVHNHADKLIIMSWAIEGQDGDGHVNCRGNRYIIDQMGQRGRQHLSIPQSTLRASVSDAAYWFRNTILVFK
jgi:hypothetical protein